MGALRTFLPKISTDGLHLLYISQCGVIIQHQQLMDSCEASSVTLEHVIVQGFSSKAQISSVSLVGNNTIQKPTYPEASGAEFLPQDTRSIASEPTSSKCSESSLMAATRPSQNTEEQLPAADFHGSSDLELRKSASSVDLLRELVLELHVYSWKELSKRLNSPREEVIQQWQQCVYPHIRATDKVAGVAKWSLQEDSILTGYIRNIGFNWQQLGLFLPGRSAYSAEGRLRRMKLHEGVDEKYIEDLHDQFANSTRHMNKHQYRKKIIRKMASRAQII